MGIYYVHVGRGFEPRHDCLKSGGGSELELLALSVAGSIVMRWWSRSGSGLVAELDQYGDAVLERDGEARGAGVVLGVKAVGDIERAPASPGRWGPR